MITTQVPQSTNDKTDIVLPLLSRAISINAATRCYDQRWKDL